MAYPFAGYVLNINCCTFAHRDAKDLEFCCIIPIGDYAKGELVLDELGLVLNIKPGNTVIFNSSKITHFNLDFEGKRISFVLTTDAYINHSDDRSDALDWFTEAGVGPTL